MKFFKKNVSQTNPKEETAEEIYNSACLNMEIATGNFKNMSQADICACVESCKPSSK